MLYEEKESIDMIRHIVAWEFADGFTSEENQVHAQKVKELLESLSNCVPGILHIQVITHPLEGTTSANVILDSAYTDCSSLMAYQEHPDHIEAGKYIRTVLKNRYCLDFEE